MPRSRKAKAKTKTKAKDQETISVEKWATLKPYGTFVVPDPNDENSLEHKFQRGDIAAILPSHRSPTEELELNDYWIGKIKDIRAELHDSDGTNTVWARVQWFYSADDAGGVVKSLNRSSIGRTERLYSDHRDFVGPECFNETIVMHQFDENDPEQPYIPRDEFYSRYTIEYKARIIKPKPGMSGCTCLNPYDPDDTIASNLMHFCPRPSCRRAYHQSCLLKGGFVDDPAKLTAAAKKSIKGRKYPNPQPTSTPSRSLRLLACSPDTNEEVNLESLTPLVIVTRSILEQSDDENHQPPKKKRRGQLSTVSDISSTPRSRKQPLKATHSETTIEDPRSLASLLAELPPDLLQVAQQPLVRGGAFPLGGIAGNVCFVTRARRLVHQILEGNAVAEDWEEVVFGDARKYDTKHAIVKLPGSKKPLPAVVCPNCKSAI